MHMSLTKEMKYKMQRKISVEVLHIALSSAQYTPYITYIQPHKILRKKLASKI